MYYQQIRFMNQLTEEQIEALAGKIKRSDKKAFDDFFRLMYPQLTGFAMGYLRDKNLAYDIVQDSFVILWQKRTGIEPEKSLRSYMYRTVRNRCLNELRNYSKVTVSSELVENVMMTIEMKNEDGNEEKDSLINRFREWITALPERQREAFELSRYEGLNHDEIADVMNISAKTVNNHIVAAISQLRENYKQFKHETSTPDE